MKKEIAIVGFVACILAGFGVGLAVKWPGTSGAGSSGSATLTHPVKGPEDALIKIIEISEFQ
jgi:hypothetical protein